MYNNVTYINRLIDFSYYKNYIGSLANSNNYFELIKLQVGIIFLIILILISCIVSVFIINSDL